MSKKIIIASDSTADLSPALLEKYGIIILPLMVSLGENLYFDGVDIDSEKIYAHYAETGELPKTSAINSADFDEFFEKHTADGSEMVFFTISSDMSSTYANARISAEKFSGVHLVDSGNLSTGVGLLVLAAAEMANEGLEASEIAKRCSVLSANVDASFIVDDLEFLHKGGRCSAVAAFGANLLQLKPCITVKGGKMSVGKKYRGKFAAVLEKYIEERIVDGSDIDMHRVFVTHAGCDSSIVESCAKLVSRLAPFEEVIITQAGATISSHCGRNTLGVLFIRKTPIEIGE
ncbi:MAG: DegV family protein [Clostridia bacterium]|nr:DegV family protein [Clostridia bacterium]